MDKKRTGLHPTRTVAPLLGSRTVGCRLHLWFNGAYQRQANGQKLLEVVRRLGIRAVIMRGWGGIETAIDQPNVLFSDYVPYDYLLPHAKVVVHHGGAGTTHAACRSGCASVIIPHLGDQIYWANSLQQMGIAPKPLSKRRWTVDGLSWAIEQMLADKNVAERTALLAHQLKTEDGTAQAVEWIERWAN